jgi:hypothetical protein
VAANTNPGRINGTVIPHKTRSGRAESRAASSSGGFTVLTKVIVARMSAGMNVDASTSTAPGKPNSKRETT